MQPETMEKIHQVRALIQEFDSIPTVSAILRPLMSYIELPEDQIEVKSIVDLVSCDGSLTAQCLRMANSPLFCRMREIYSVRGAVIVLGVRRLRDIMLTCLLVRMVPKSSWVMDPLSYWQHSLACALVSRQFAKKINFADREQAYLAGLLHDLGCLVNTLLFPEEFRAAIELVRTQKLPICEAESQTIGLTHCQTGQILAENWKLPEKICHVIGFHHDVQQSRVSAPLVALVSLSDTLCRMGGLGYDFDELDQVDLLDDPAWWILTQEYPHMSEFDLASFTSEMGEFAVHVRDMVNSVYPS